MKQLVFLILALAFINASHCAWAQSYPVKPVRFILPFSAGGSYDALGRIIAEKMSESLGQQVVVENRPGAGSIIGTELAARAAHDGYTLIMLGNNHAVGPAVYSKIPYDVVKDFAPIGLVATLAITLVVHPSLPAKSVKELIALARTRPGELNYGSGGNGGISHLGGEMFKSMAGINLVHVPYKSGVAATIDLIAGQVQLTFLNVLSSRPHVASGKLRALAIASEKRSAFWPELLTMMEAGVPGYVLTEWGAIAVPSGTPREIVARLNSEIARIVKLPDTRERFSRQGAEPADSSAEQFMPYFIAETQKYARIVKIAGIRVE